MWEQRQGYIVETINNTKELIIDRYVSDMVKDTRK